MVNNYDPFPDIYYDEKESRLFQGDIIVGISIDLSNIEDSSTIAGLMILNNTCDLHQDRIDHILLSPIRPLAHLVQEWFARGDKKDDIVTNTNRIVRNMAANSYFLPPTDRFSGNSPNYVDFAIMFPFPYNSTLEKELLKCRVASIQSPCREKLGHILGNYFSRIGLPPQLDIKREILKSWKSKFLEENLSASKQSTGTISESQEG